MLVKYYALLHNSEHALGFCYYSLNHGAGDEIRRR